MRDDLPAAVAGAGGSGADTADAVADPVTEDIADPRLYAGERPEEIWRAMRGAGRPLRMGGVREHWAVTRYQQVRRTLRHSDRLSSEKGHRLGEKPTDALAGEMSGGLSILVADDPAHARMRRVLEPAFSPRALRRLTASTRDLAHRLVRDAVAHEQVEFVEQVVTPLLSTVVCELLGIPDSDRPTIADVARRVFGGSGHTTATEQITAHVEVLGYCHELLAHKRRVPGEDVATLLAQAGRGTFSPEAAVMNCHDLVVGGNASARYALTSVPMTLLTQPAFWARLRSGDADLDVATEELLRCETPVNHVMRCLLDDLEIAGTRMRGGELVTLWLRSANRDETVFDEPDVMRPEGRGLPQLSFGQGPHYCIAATLARLEISSLLRALAALVRGAELAGQPIRLESNLLRGYRSVPMRLSG